MKPRSDTVPSWPFALACIVLLVAVACRQMNFITPKNTHLLRT